jgi:AcrR family transcriptional regulator
VPGSQAGRPVPSRGRPRDPAIDSAVLDATIRLLADVGVDGTSMEKVAAAAGVSKVTVYARFSSKSELIGAALAHLRIGDIPTLTGDVEDDLVALMVAMRHGHALAGGMSIVGTCLTTEARSTEFLEIVRRSTLWPRRNAFARVLQEAIDVATLKADTDVQGTVSMLIGSFYADYLAGRPMNKGWERTVVRQVLAGIRVDASAREGRATRHD